MATQGSKKSSRKTRGKAVRASGQIAGRDTKTGRWITEKQPTRRTSRAADVVPHKRTRPRNDINALRERIVTQTGGTWPNRPKQPKLRDL